MKERTDEAHAAVANELEVENTVFYHVDIPRVNNLTINKFEDELKAFKPESGSTLLIDLGSVDFMNSQGFVSLIKAQKDFKNVNGKIVLLDVGQRIKDSMDLSGISVIFEMHNSNK